MTADTLSHLQPLKPDEASQTTLAEAPEAVGEFIEQLGLIVEGDGLPRIAGRILGFLIVYGGPFSFSELAERLEVSRASVSTNTRLLEGMGVITRLARRGERQDYFRLAHDPYRSFMVRLAERSRSAQSMVDETRHALPTSWKDANERLRELSEFYERIGELSRSVAASLQSGK